METLQPRRQVLVPFVCPVCAAQNAVELVALSRAGGMSCTGCKRHLRSADVMRAMHAPRAATQQVPAAPTRSAPAASPPMVWPPTAESRAAIAPPRRRRDGDTN